MNLSGTGFRLGIPVILAFIAFLIAAGVSTASAASVKPSGLTAELCGDAVCLNWTPGTGDFNLKGVQVWEGDPDNFLGSMAIDYEGQARIPVEYLFIRPTQSSGDTVAFYFQVLALKINSYNAIENAAKSNMVTLHVPRPGSEGQTVEIANSGGPDIDLCDNAICPPGTPGSSDHPY